MNLFILSGHAGDSFAAFLNEVIFSPKQNEFVYIVGALEVSP